jgi:hypothetical protein
VNDLSESPGGKKSERINENEFGYIDSEKD